MNVLQPRPPKSKVYGMGVHRKALGDADKETLVEWALMSGRGVLRYTRLQERFNAIHDALEDNATVNSIPDNELQAIIDRFNEEQ